MLNVVWFLYIARLVTSAGSFPPYEPPRKCLFPWGVCLSECQWDARTEAICKLMPRLFNDEPNGIIFSSNLFFRQMATTALNLWREVSFTKYFVQKALCCWGQRGGRSNWLDALVDSADDDERPCLVKSPRVGGQRGGRSRENRLDPSQPIDRIPQ